MLAKHSVCCYILRFRDIDNTKKVWGLRIWVGKARADLLFLKELTGLGKVPR